MILVFLGTWFFAVMLFVVLDMLRVKWILYWRTHGERPFFEPWEYSEMEGDVDFWDILSLVVVIGIIVWVAGWWVGVW
jgi:hypothetical protein